MKIPKFKAKGKPKFTHTNSGEGSTFSNNRKGAASMVVLNNKETFSTLSKSNSICTKQSTKRKICITYSKNREHREKIINKENWNYFVGDQDYKTDHFLNFKSPVTQMQFEKHVFASSAYSLRGLLLIVALLSYLIFHSISLVTILVVLAPAIVASYYNNGFPQTPFFQNGAMTHIAKLIQTHHYARLVVVNFVPFFFGLYTLNLYGLMHQYFESGHLEALFKM